MNKRLAGVLAFAFLISVGASVVLYKLLSARFAVSQTAGNGTPIVVAARSLAVGTLIKETDLRVMSWNGPPPAQAVTSIEQAVGRGVISAMFDNEPVLENRLAPKGAGGGMAATIPVGMRAVAVRVDDVTGLAGFVTPGLRVDVLILGTPPGADGHQRSGSVSRTLLQNMEVLSAGQQIQKDAEGKPIPVPVVNLLATPEQAEILSLANANARIQLILRNPMDKELSKTTGMELSRLYDGAPAPPVVRPVPIVSRAPRPYFPPPPPAVTAAPAPVSPRVVEVIHGTKRLESKFTDQAVEKDKTQD